MSIQFYDSLSRKVVSLEPREPGRVTMYVCGPTVYNYIHIGNARTLVWFDFIRSYLAYRGYDVTYVSNYTDVDDRIIERANIEGVPTEGISQKYARAFEEDMAALGARSPDVLVLATQHIEDMIKAIEGLIERGAAYETDGDVWFAVDRFEGYGKLSGRSLDDMRAGERVEPSEAKRHPLDFALWKSAKEGEPSWESPWGPGRPGWHIECSVMSTKYLGMGFDIHGGGSDLIFPHHENEIAQAEAAAGEGPFARYWLHSGMVQMESEKMSKSLGNVVLAREVVKLFPGEVVRYWALSASYRSQPVFSGDALDDAAQAHDRWRTFLHGARHVLGDEMPVSHVVPVRKLGEPLPNGPGAPFMERFLAAMDDDFNSAEAFAAIHELVREANKALEGAQKDDDDARAHLRSLSETFIEMASVFGFSLAAGDGPSELTADLLDYLMELRDQARNERAFERADSIRARLAELGVAIEDTPAGTRWRVGTAPNG